MADHDDFMGACLDMLPRLGATTVEIRYSEPDEDTDGPTVWMAIATINTTEPSPPQVAAALSPVQAAFALLENLVDGGRCAHCKRPTGITADFEQMPAPKAVCWYQFDPELKKFRRGCE